MNILGIDKKYLRFFVDNAKSRWMLVQGSRRSGKSFNCYKWLRFLASGKPIKVGIVAASFPALQLAISDFQRATGLVVGGSTVYGYSCRLDNGSLFVFDSYSEPTKAQGSTFDILYLEEALNISYDVIRVLAMSVTDKIIACYNPTKTSDLERYKNADGSNWLKTTYRDNPWLTDAQRQEFVDMEERAKQPDASILDVWAAEVYCYGNFSAMGGKVFKKVFTCSDEEFERIPATEVFAIDFGFVQSEQADATALVGVKIYEGKLYGKEYLYGTDLADNRTLALRMADLGLDVNTYIVGDAGGLGRTRIRALITAGDYTWTEPQICNGFSVLNAVKGSVFDGLMKMNQYEIHVTESSVNLRRELDAYELTAEGKPKSGCIDHATDAFRYGTMSYRLFVD